MSYDGCVPVFLLFCRCFYTADGIYNADALIAFMLTIFIFITSFSA